MWMVQLAGDNSDLAALAQSLTGSDLNVSHDGKGYVLTSDRFSSGDDAGAVRQTAQEMIAILNGASRLALEAKKAITVGSVYRRDEDGRRDSFIFPEPARIRIRAFPPTMKISRADGTVEEFCPADPVRQWTALALKNDAIAKVFRILAGGTLDWVNLYRIFELIGDDVGGVDRIAANCWATKASIKLFKRTSNSPGALGLDARHGAEKSDDNIGS